MIIPINEAENACFYSQGPFFIKVTKKRFFDDFGLFWAYKPIMTKMGLFTTLPRSLKTAENS